MNESENKDENFPFGKSLICAFLGIGSVISLISLIYTTFAYEYYTHLYMIPILAYGSYLLLYTAYKGKEPSRFQGKNVFKTKDKVDNENKKKQYSDITRFFFALIGVTLLLTCMYEVFRAITENKFNLLIMASGVGYVGYVFSHAAYKGKAPSWYDDKSIFKSNNSNNKSNVDNQ